MRIRSFLTVGLLLVLIGTQGLAQETKEEQQNHDFSRPLGLTESQIEKMRDIRTESSKDLLPLTKSLQTREAELEEMMVAEKPNRKTIDDKIEEIQALRTEIQKRRVTARLQTRDLLTEEQRVNWESFRGRRLSGRGFMGQRFRHSRPGIGARRFERFRHSRSGIGAGRYDEFSDQQRRRFSERSPEIEDL